MCNYVSIGLDARVGIGFDKRRQTNRLMNKGVYAWEGMKKLLFKKKGVLGDILARMSQFKDIGLETAASGHNLEASQGKTVFSTASSSASHLHGNPVSMIFLNIPSIAGGLDIWKWSKSRLGVADGDPALLRDSQDFGDGKLECLSYRTGLSFYTEQLRSPTFISGNGSRVYSGEGTLKLQFRTPTDASFVKGTSHCKGRTYMQVDGEFFIVYQPESLVIRNHQKIQVLVNDVQPGCC